MAIDLFRGERKKENVENLGVLYDPTWQAFCRARDKIIFLEEILLPLVKSDGRIVGMQFIDFVRMQKAKKFL